MPRLLDDVDIGLAEADGGDDATWRASRRMETVMSLSDGDSMTKELLSTWLFYSRGDVYLILMRG